MKTSKPYQTILNLIALSIIIFIVVDVFYTIVRGKIRPVNATKVMMPFLPEAKEYRKPPLNDYRGIIEENIFGTTVEKKEGGQEEVKEAVEVLEPTSLKVVLLGTGTVEGDPQSDVAVIRDPAKKSQNFYRVGDTVQGAVVKKILRGKVIVRIGDKDEILMMEEKDKKQTEKKSPASKRTSKRASKPTGEEATTLVNRSDLEGSLKNINKLLSQVRIRPHFKGGKADGLSVTRIKPGSIIDKLGLKNGDVIHGINGKAVKGPDGILELYKKLKSGSRVSLEISRKNKIKTINYSFH